MEPVDLASPGPVPTYLREMAPVCPFVEPSARAGLLFAVEVTPDCREPADVHPRLFEQLVPLIERFRDVRRALPSPQQRLLVCHTAVIRLPSHLDGPAVQLLRWPNLLAWSLKQLYTSKEVVLGVVRKGVAERSMAGAAVPIAPFHAVIIRSRVVNADARFFPRNRALLDALMNADDDGADVHGPLLGTVPDVRDPDALRADRYYQRVLGKWRQQAGAGQ
jgi:hypothetical protein